MKPISLLVILLVALAPASHAGAPARDFDLQGYITSAIQSGSKQVTVPPGRYRVAPRQGCHLRFTGLNNFTVIADGVEMICTQTVPAMAFQNCRNVHIRGLTVDYDPLPFTEGRITAMAPDKSWVEFQVFRGYPENQLVDRIEIFDPATRELRRETVGWSGVFQPLGNHRYRISKPPNYRYEAGWDTEQVGDILVTNNCFPDGASGHAVNVTDCTGVELENVTLYAASDFGFLESGCTGTTYLGCKIDRRTPEDDPVQREFPRMRSLNADAFHSVNAIKGPSIIGCTARYQGDDCVNIHGFYDLILSSTGNRIRAVALQRERFKPGDPVEFLPFHGPRPPDAVAQTVKPALPMTGAQEALFQKINLLPQDKQRILSGRVACYELTLDHPVNLPPGSALCPGNQTGNGFLVKDCNFGHNRSRGILIKASHGQVVGNTIAHGWMAAVLVSPEYWWLESASSSDVIIRGNKIIGCRRPAIQISAPGGDGKPLPSGAHRNITIQDNTITDSEWPNIDASSTDHLVVKDNQLTPADPTDIVPPIAHPWGWAKDPPAPVVIQFCNHSDIELSGTTAAK